MIELWAAAFAMGFLGSLHCVGMCGGLVSAMTMTRSRTWWPGVSVYQLGRITTYLTLGLIAGWLGSFFHDESAISDAQSIISFIAGGLIIVFALHIAGWLPDPFASIAQRITRITGLDKLIRTAATQDKVLPWYSVGLVNGLLPCGLVYAALGLSLTAPSAFHGATIMFVFGLGTVPAMLMVPAIIRAITPQARSKVLKIGVVFLIIIGIFTMLRGTSLGQHEHQHHENNAPMQIAPENNETSHTTHNEHHMHSDSHGAHEH